MAMVWMSDADQHVAVDDRLLGRARRLVHDVRVALFRAQRQGRRAVGDQVQPQQLDGGQRQEPRSPDSSVARKMIRISAMLQESR